MARNIVVLLDGTSNEIKKNRTNIVRLYGCLERSDRQLVYYDPGVGTMGAANSWSPTYRRLVEVWGLATGFGLDQNVKEAYSYLIEHYQEGDRIFIFGFSRGAYTARVLAALIHAVGLITHGQLNLLEYIYRAYSRIKKGEEMYWGSEDDPVSLFRKMLKPQHPTIRCLGLFDTVGSVLQAGRLSIFPKRKIFAWTDWNTSVQAVRHAVAIDERRVSFRPQLWPKGESFSPINEEGWIGAPVADQDVREVWFTGVHADIGGGYAEGVSGLAKISLDWMIKETRAMDLHFQDDTVNVIVLGLNADGSEKTAEEKQKAKKLYAIPHPDSERNESMNGAWRFLEWLAGWRRRKNSPNVADHARGGWRRPHSPRTIPDGAWIHHTVFDRTASDLDQTNMPRSYKVFRQSDHA